MIKPQITTDGDQINRGWQFISFLFFVVCALMLPNSLAGAKQIAGEGGIYFLTVRGAIGPATSEYIQRGIKICEEKSASALILKLDTPGGLDEAMREIVQAILSTRVPFITFVYPSGARAASAGTFILIASHLAAMAEGTTTGAAHPVSIGAKEIPQEMKEKIEEDAAAFLKSLALKRKRDTTFAVAAVKKSMVLTDREALERKVIDCRANSCEELLKKIDGRKVVVDNQELVISTRGKASYPIDMNARERFLQALTNPNLAYILLMIGMYGIIFELQNPGSLFPGVVGALSLILAFYSFRILPVNYAGLFLIGLSFLFFLLEIRVASYGLLSAGGIISFILGSLLLFPNFSPFFPFSISVIIIATIITILFFLLIISLGIKAHLKKPVSGKEGMVNLVGEVVDSFSAPVGEDILPSGQVFVRGEYWPALSLSGPLKKGDKVRVVEVQGMVLKVKALKEEVKSNRGGL